MVSDGTTDNFEPANEGFDHRRVVSLVVDRENPGRLGAVLANASDSVVVSEDAGETWAPLGSGLRPRPYGGFSRRLPAGMRPLRRAD